jgi:hypothetical protein
MTSVSSHPKDGENITWNKKNYRDVIFASFPSSYGTKEEIFDIKDYIKHS